MNVSSDKMDELEKLLVRELSTVLSNEEINSLAKKNESTKNILLYDYLKFFSAGNFSMLDVIMKMQHSINLHEQKDFKFKSPKKRMLLELYKQNLSGIFHSLVPALKTKTELKQLYCLDEIYRHLSDERRKRMDLSRDLTSLLNSSIESCINQEIARKMAVEIEKFADLTDKINYSNIKVGQIRYLKSKSKKIDEFAKKASSDYEIIQRVKQSKEMIKDLNKRIFDGVESLLGKIVNYKFEIEALSKDKFLSQADFARATENRDDLIEIQKVLDDLERPDRTSPVIQEYNFLIKTYLYYWENHNYFEELIEDQKIANERLEKIKSQRKKSFLEFIRRGRIGIYLNRTERNLKRMVRFYENRYFRQKLDDEKEGLMGQFREIELNEKWPEKVRSKYKRISGCFDALKKDMLYHK